MNCKRDRYLLIVVFDGGTDDVLHLDFSFSNLKFYNVDSKEFTRLVDSFNYYFPIGNASNNFSNTFFHHLQYDQPRGFHPSLYTLVTIDFEKGTDSEVIFKIRLVLLIMFPSDF